MTASPPAVSNKEQWGGWVGPSFAVVRGWTLGFVSRRRFRRALRSIADGMPIAEAVERCGERDEAVKAFLVRLLRSRLGTGHNGGVRP